MGCHYRCGTPLMIFHPRIFSPFPTHLFRFLRFSLLFVRPVFFVLSIQCFPFSSPSTRCHRFSITYIFCFCCLSSWSTSQLSDRFFFISIPFPSSLNFSRPDLSLSIFSFSNPNFCFAEHQFFECQSGVKSMIFKNCTDFGSENFTIWPPEQGRQHHFSDPKIRKISQWEMTEICT